MESFYVWILLVCVVIVVLRRRKPSVTDSEIYHNICFLRRKLSASFMYENPSNFEIKDDKLVPTCVEIRSRETFLSSYFRDKIPWCLPPIFGGGLEMKGPFPSTKACRLEDLESLLKSNMVTFMTDFNDHRDQFVENPEELGYGNVYGRIDVNGDGNALAFAETRKLLGQDPDYARTQDFNKYAQFNFMATFFTILYPGASIRPHFGPTNYKYRLHICLDVDGVGGIVTAYDTRFWKKGEVFILDDSYLHAGFYEGTRPRVILMVDIAKRGLNQSHVDHFLQQSFRH